MFYLPRFICSPLPQLTIFVFHHEYPPLPIYHNPTSQFNFTSKISKPPTIRARGILGCLLDVFVGSTGSYRNCHQCWACRSDSNNTYILVAFSCLITRIPPLPMNMEIKRASNSGGGDRADNFVIHQNIPQYRGGVEKLSGIAWSTIVIQKQSREYYRFIKFPTLFSKTSFM